MRPAKGLNSSFVLLIKIKQKTRIQNKPRSRLKSNKIFQKLKSKIKKFV